VELCARDEEMEIRHTSVEGLVVYIESVLVGGMSHVGAWAGLFVWGCLFVGCDQNMYDCSQTEPHADFCLGCTVPLSPPFRSNCSFWSHGH